LELTASVYDSSCNPVGTRTTAYLNRAEVQSYLGAKPTVWSECANLNYTISGDSMIPYYKRFFAQNPNFHVLIYSGDVDIATVPFAYTKVCLDELHGDSIEPWQPWFVNGATAGYVETFETYTYATVKGGGHEVHLYEPYSAFNMFQRYLTSQNLLTGENSNAGRSASSRPLRQSDLLRKLGIH